MKRAPWPRALIACFAILRFVALFAVPTFLSDTAYYREFARRIAVGALPYRDFPFEYPPLALAPVCVPEFLQNAIGLDSLNGYRAFYWAIFCGIDCALFAWIVRRLREGRASALGAWAYVLGGACLAELIYDRFDLALGALTFAAIAWAVDRKPARSAAALVAGAFYKVVPLAFAPIFAAWSWRQSSGRSRIVWTGSAAVGLAIGGALTWAAFGANSIGLFAFHSRRGIQIESIWSTTLWAASQLGGAAFPALELNYGAMHLAHWSGGLDAVAALAPIGAALAIAAWTAFARRPIALGRAIFIAGAATIALGKVLSPQYLAWLIAIAPLADFESDRTFDRAIAFAMVAVCALTGYEFHSYLGLVNLEAPPWIAALARDWLLLAIAIALAWDAVIAPRATPFARGRANPPARSRRSKNSPSRA